VFVFVFVLVLVLALEFAFAFVLAFASTSVPLEFVTIAPSTDGILTEAMLEIAREQTSVSVDSDVKIRIPFDSFTRASFSFW